MIQKLDKDSTRKLKFNIPMNIDSKFFNKILENQQHIKRIIYQNQMRLISGVNE